MVDGRDREGGCHIREAFDRLDPAKRRRILDAAMDEFARYGYRNASTNRIAQAARIGKGMLFHYFGSKRDLYLCLVDYSIDYVETEFLARVVPAKEGLVERLQRIAKAEIEAIAGNPHVFRFLATLYLDDTASLPGDQARRLEEMRREWLAKIYGDADTSTYRDDVPPQHVHKIIVWCMEGYERELIDSIDRDAVVSQDWVPYWEDYDGFLNSLKRILYRQEDDTSGDSHNS